MSPADQLEANRDRLEAALLRVASLVTLDTEFLPFYLRLEEELANLDRQCSAFDRARRLAASQKAIC